MLMTTALVYVMKPAKHIDNKNWSWILSGLSCGLNAMPPPYGLVVHLKSYNWHHTWDEKKWMKCFAIKIFIVWDSSKWTFHRSFIHSFIGLLMQFANILWGTKHVFLNPTYAPTIQLKEKHEWCNPISLGKGLDDDD
jgi:hypothetical protein